MREVSVEDFKLFKEKVDNFITKDAETFYFRNLMEAIHDIHGECVHAIPKK